MIVWTVGRKKDKTSLNCPRQTGPRLNAILESALEELPITLRIYASRTICPNEDSPKTSNNIRPCASLLLEVYVHHVNLYYCDRCVNQIGLYLVKL